MRELDKRAQNHLQAPTIGVTQRNTPPELARRNEANPGSTESLPSTNSVPRQPLRPPAGRPRRSQQPTTLIYVDVNED